MSNGDADLKPVIGDWLAARADVNGGALALHDLATGRAHSYRDFLERSQRIAGVLHATYAISPGDRVMVLAHNSTDLYEILMACWRIGAVYMPVNWRLAKAEISDIAADATPRVIIADTEFAALVDGLDIPQWMRGDGADDPFETELAAADPVTSFFDATPDTMTTLLYTSGTTGEPKGVIGTWRMQAMAVRQAAHVLLGERTNTLTAAPMFHTAGLNSFSLPSFYYGGAVHIMRRWDAPLALKCLSDPDIGITHTLGVPVQFQQMAALPEFESARFPTVNRAGVGAAPVTEDLLKTFQDKGLMLCNSYGMTEVFGVATLPPERAQDKLGAVGWPVIGSEVRIADDSDTPVANGVMGEIQIKSEGVTPGYWNAPEQSAASRTADGWHKTGDVGRLDDDGALYVVDRKKDMFISGGENVYPAEIENVLADWPEVREAAVIGVPDETWGEVGHAIIVLTTGAALDLHEVQQRCTERLARFKVPKHVSFIDALPRSAQGKVLKTELRDRYAG